MSPPRTPDGRYIVHVGRAGPRLWRAANPYLSTEQREVLTAKLMDGRRAVRTAKGNPELLALARSQVDAAKRELGERGPVWWTDGSADLNRMLIKNSPYNGWWQARLAHPDNEPISARDKSKISRART